MTECKSQKRNGGPYGTIFATFSCHELLISTALFERVQEILDGRYSTKEKVTKHEFTFSGLVHCGHCGCALVGEKKKGKYVYYHCTGNKGNAPNLTHEKKCLKRALPTYSRDL